MKKAIIVDIDGTIALNTSGRPFYGKGAAEGMLSDEPVQLIINTVKLYCKQTDSDLIIVTGRECTSEIKNATECWLSNQGIVPDLLLMRPVKNYTSAAVCKKLLYDTYIKDKYEIVFVLEDTEKCVEMWNSEGLYCIQVPSDLEKIREWEFPNNVIFDGWARMSYKYLKAAKKEFVEFLLNNAETTANKLLTLEYISKEDLLPRKGGCDDMPTSFVKCSYEEPELFSRYETIDFYGDLDTIYEYLKMDDSSEELWENLVNETFEYVKQTKRIGNKYDW